MPYSFEMPLIEAYKRLHMLGHRGGTPYAGDSGKGGVEAGAMIAGGAALGGILGAGRSKSKKPVGGPAAEHPLSSNDPYKPVDIEQSGWSQEKQNVALGRALPENPYDRVIAAHERADEAKDMAFGGVYTPEGLQSADRDATLNAEDRLRARALVGQGMQMSMSPYVGGR